MSKGICLNLFERDYTYLNITRHVFEYVWTWLNIPECLTSSVWTCLNVTARTWMSHVTCRHTSQECFLPADVWNSLSGQSARSLTLQHCRSVAFLTRSSFAYRCVGQLVKSSSLLSRLQGTQYWSCCQGRNDVHTPWRVSIMNACYMTPSAETPAMVWIARSLWCMPGVCVFD